MQNVEGLSPKVIVGIILVLVLLLLFMFVLCCYSWRRARKGKSKGSGFSGTRRKHDVFNLPGLRS